MRFAPIAAAALLCAAAQAEAEPATPEGAKALAAAYDAYLPRKFSEQQVVAITAEGEDYVVSWDVGKLMAALDAPADMVKAAPLVYRVTPQAGGGWKLAVAALPALTIGPTKPGGGDGGTVGFDGFRFEGVYDPAAPDFFRGRLGMQGVNADVKSPVGDKLQHVVMANEAIAGDVKVRAGGAVDSVDVGTTESSVGAAQKTTLIDGDKETPVTDTHQGAGAGDGGVKSLRAKALGELWRFIVAHDKKGDDADEELKAKLAAVLPLWDEAAGKIHLDDLVVAFPGGSLKIKASREELRMTGLAKTSSMTLTLGFDQVAVEAESLPAWLKSVWPASLTLTLEAGVDGLDEIATKALDAEENFDTRDEDKAAIGDLFTEGRPHVGLKATRLATPLIEATFEGEASYGDEGPAATAKITADTLDKVLAELAKAVPADPTAQQAIYFVTFARGLAKTEDGRLVWNIEYLGPNSVEVNGQKFPPE